MRETNIQLTPVLGGRFEVYVNDEKVYDRLEAGEGDFYRGLRVIRQVRKTLLAALGEEAVPAHA